MMIRNIIDSIVFSFVVSLSFLAVSSAAWADDFSVSLTVNGNDVSEMGAVEIDPDGEFTVDLRIFDNTHDVTLHQLSVSVIFMDITILTINEPLNDSRLLPGEEYHQKIPVDAREYLKLGDTTLTTGKYRTRVELEYSVGDSSAVWGRWVNLQVVGNPIMTPVGGAGAAISVITLGAVVWLAKGLSGLYHFAIGHLEALTRGRVVGSFVDAARKRIVRDRCPICGERFQGGYCPKCKKSVKEIRREYHEKLQELAQQGEKMLADGEATFDNLSEKMGIDGRLAEDVIAIIRDARLFRMQGIARKLMVRAFFTGIGIAISTIIWIIVGGLAALSTPALVAILIAAIFVPLAITWGFRIKAKRAMQRSTI